MKKLTSLLLLTAGLGTAPAAVTLTFDSTTNGFTVAGGGVNAVAWNAGNGGRLALTTGPGFNMQVAKLDLNNAAVATEFQNAKLYGGTISYTVTVEPGAITGGNPNPNWFEGSFLANSGNFLGDGNPANTNAYDQNWNTAGGNFNIGAWPLATPFTASLTYPIALVASGGQANNGLAEFVSGPSNYNEVFIGLNSGATANPAAAPPVLASFTTATFYIDNFTITANPVPEPGAAGLALLAGLTLAAGRRRSA